MIIKHQGKTPVIDKSAFIAPNAVVCGDITIGQNVRVLFGAQIIAENSFIVIGNNCIILENAVIRATKGHHVSIGKNSLIGPNTHLTGCTLEENVFIATGASVFHGALIKQGAEVRINSIVHIKTVVAENTTIPIGWIAIGNPAKILPPVKKKKIGKILSSLNFPGFVYEIKKNNKGKSVMPEVCQIMADRLSEHKKDEIIGY